LRRSLQEFLAVPLVMILGFIVLAVVTSVLDRTDIGWLQPVQQALAKVAPPQQNQSMLRTVAPGVLTLMTITFFLLLTLVNRMADVFTWVVVEQFLSRRAHKAFFGYFAGLSTYYVIVLTLSDPQRAVLSTVVALILSVLALVGLVIFGYLVLDQLRPPSVVERIVQLTVATRAEQSAWLRRLRDKSQLEQLPTTIVRSECSGYLVDIDVDSLSRALESTSGAVEVEFCVRLGSHLVEGSALAGVRAERQADRERLAGAVYDALRCGRERQLNREPVYGVHQLSSIGWASATQRDPEAALVTVDGLHTLLAHWVHRSPSSGGQEPDDQPLPVVYRDTAIPEVLSALSSIAVGAAQGGQHQTCAQVFNVFAMALPDLPAEYQRMVTAQLRHALPGAATHPLTNEMERALTALRRALSDNGQAGAAAEVARLGSRLGNQQPEG
jgi:uncharacterized membrane protein